MPPPSRFADREERLATEGREKYQGTARIRLDVLHFPQNEPRELDQKNLERLKGYFKNGQCHRAERNHIPAVIDQAQLSEVLRDSKVSAKTLLNNTDPHPMLKFPVGSQLHCLHGRHRIQAAREVLKPRESWWTVDLYLADADHELKTALIEEYANEKPPSAGEIYCKIYKYTQERDLYSEGRWRSRLSENDTRCLDQLSRHPDLKAGFDDLLDLPGLWGGMRISTLSKLMSMGCSENAVHYLKGIKDVWSQIFRHDKQAMRMLDNATVKAVELTSPKHSKRDAQMLHGQLVSGRIFAAFNPQDREVIWSELSKIGGLITSLYSFFADLNYLHACAYSMRYLVGPSPTQTLCSALDAIFFGAPEDWDLAYRLLWLYIMQNVTDLPPPSDENKTKRKRLAKARPRKVDEVVLSNFAALAIRLGFKSDQISALSQRSADREIARAALLNARKSDRYEYTDAILESNVEQIVRLFDTATSVQVEQVCPAFVSDDPAASGVRCGFPDEEAHARDAASLSVANLHVEVTEQGESITSFFVRRSVYFAFFGRPSETSTGHSSHPSPPQDPSFGEVESSPFQPSRSNPASNTSDGVRGGPEHEGAGREGSALEEQRLARLEHAARDGEELEGMEVEVLEPDGQEQERQESLHGHNNVREESGSQQTARNRRPNTFIEIERIITDGLASTSEGQATEDLEDLAHSYRGLIGTDNVDADDNRQEHNQAPDSQLQRVPAPSTVRIEFKIHERDNWRTVRSLLVDVSDPSEVERVAKKYMRKGIRPLDSSLNLLVPSTCFQAATADGSYTILLVPENRIEVNNQVLVSVSNEMSEELPLGGRQNRARH